MITGQTVVGQQQQQWTNNTQKWFHHHHQRHAIPQNKWISVRLLILKHFHTLPFCFPLKRRHSSVRKPIIEIPLYPKCHRSVWNESLRPRRLLPIRFSLNISCKFNFSPAKKNKQIIRLSVTQKCVWLMVGLDGHISSPPFRAQSTDR